MPRNRRTWLGFTALCLLSGSSWLLDESHPSELIAPRQIFVDNLLLALFFAVIATSQADWPSDRSGWLRLTKLGALGLFIIALPALLLPGSGVASTTSALIFLLVPAVVVFTDSQGAHAFGRDTSPFPLLLPALAALMGASLILPFIWPVDSIVQRNLILLLASAITAGVALVHMHRLMVTPASSRMRILPALAFICSFTALAAGPLALHNAPWNGAAIELELLRCAVYSLPALFLTGWLLRELRPPVFAARAFFTVVITLVESYIVLRPSLTWPMLLGTALLLGGAIGLLRQNSPEPSVTPAKGTVNS